MARRVISTSSITEPQNGFSVEQAKILREPKPEVMQMRRDRLRNLLTDYRDEIRRHSSYDILAWGAAFIGAVPAAAAPNDLHFVVGPEAWRLFFSVIAALSFLMILKAVVAWACMAVRGTMSPWLLRLMPNLGVPQEWVPMSPAEFADQIFEEWRQEEAPSS